MDSKTNILTKIINSLKFIIFLSMPLVLKVEWYTRSFSLLICIFSFSSTLQVVHLHRGLEVHFFLTWKINRTMWENFFLAVIPENASLTHISYIIRFYGMDLYCKTTITFSRWLCRDIVFRNFLPKVSDSKIRTSAVTTTSWPPNLD